MSYVLRLAVGLVAAVALAIGGGNLAVALASPTVLPIDGTPECTAAVANDGAVIAAERTLRADRARLAKLVTDAQATDNAAPGAALSTLTLPITIDTDLLGSLTAPVTVGDLRGRVADVQALVQRDATAVTDAEGKARGSKCQPAASSSPTTTTTTPPATSTGDDADAIAAKRCVDFTTRESAQAYYDAHGGINGHATALDTNHDGVACEAPVTAAAGTPAPTTTTTPPAASSSSSTTVAPHVDTTHTNNPTADDGSSAATSGSQIKVVPDGSVDTGEWEG